jgi:hypothetical protein
MTSTEKRERRKHPRFKTAIPVRFNLNPDYHFVPAIRKLGVGGKARNISSEGLQIDSQMDLLDLCQIFSEAIEDNAPFELEVFLVDPRERRTLIKGAVRWYRLDELKGDIRHFQAGLYLKDAESRAIARNIIEYTSARK